ncbi:olfactory receptor class A-like protein 1 [Esox lucius]|uniref:olfactory receptor class A-like protein 1 n=1 Tax=Esox lucius TaxID=8010 RepID=UPI00147745F4|nr:olfactory receptor class A-like protein 1 [Esox lucius]XP_019910919.2 olfactory receptor class A-like protein 1 [Esox lucius]XP_034143345.1 olfactory receptor class A-like protein 1 [Esox lucius]
MESEEVIRGMLYLSLTVVGVPGNSAVIVAFFLSLYHQPRLAAADAIVLHLVCANLVVVGVRCPLETLATFRLANVFGDKTCQGVIFVYRMSRSLSIWLTFVLSTYQCLSISPPGSRWASFRVLVARHLHVVFFTLWVITASMSSAAISYSVGYRNDSSLSQNSVNVRFCYIRFPSVQSMEFNGAVSVGRDVVPMALMTASSMLILVFLYRHSQQVQGIRSSSRAGGGAEQRAAKAVVALVTLYVVLYGVDNGLWVYTLTVRQTLNSPLISDLRIFFSSLFSAISPFLIIATNRKVSSRLRCEGQKRPVEDNATTLSTV